MTLVERYILRIAFGAFAATLVGLTAVIWITQALRELDLLTSKGQTILMFFIVTGLSLPTLITVISVGSDKPVTMKNIRTVCPLLVSRSSSRRAWVIQITAVSPISVAAKAPKAILRI